MFEKDNWQEIFETISRNKLRTFLTCFSVAWGIFILVILMACGKGLRNGTENQFSGDAANSIWIRGGTTSTAYHGYKPGREIFLTLDDYYLIKSKLHDIIFASAMHGGNSKLLSYKNEHAGYLIRGVMPDHCFLEKAVTIKGRFINQRDIDECRKVCSIAYRVEETLFKGEDPIGKYIDAEGLKYKVAGVFKDPGDGDNDRIYVPITTFQKEWNLKNRISNVWIGNGNTSVIRTFAMGEEIRGLLASKYNFDVNDKSAIEINDNNVEYSNIINMLSGISIFVKVMAILTLIAGIVGVSNIMMIIVKERTREIGIRKAIGATPYSIVSQILMESVFITAVAGYIGLLLGVGLIEIVKTFGIDSEYFKNPDVDFNAALFSTILLIIAGALAGLIPSIKASRIVPVDALKEE